jgi:hypothetical protein
MKITISNEIIRRFDPCYDPSRFIKDENEELTVKEWVHKYRKVVPPKDILWLLLRREFLSEKDLRLFAVWCAREALKLIEDPDERSVEACNVAEKYANGEATKEELLAASHAADYATDDAYNAVYHIYYASYYVARAAYYAARVTSDAAYAAYGASYEAARASYYAARATSDADAIYDAADDVANAFRDAQLDNLLTHFE